jgi:hypothetical protein
VSEFQELDELAEKARDIAATIFLLAVLKIINLLFICISGTRQSPYYPFSAI